MCHTFARGWKHEPARVSAVKGALTGVDTRVFSSMWFSSTAITVAVSRGSKLAAARAALEAANTVIGVVDEASGLSRPANSSLN